VRASQPELIIHCAAQMRGSFDDLRLVNATGTGFLASYAREASARMIHLSTDLVFDGRRGNYREEDPPNPMTDYAKSKFEAEEAVRTSGAAAIIVRTSLIYGFAPPDPRTRAMLGGDMPRLFVDEQRCPIWVETLCDAMLELCEQDYTGILHVAGEQALSRYSFGVKLVNALGGDSGRLIPSRSEESGLVRPLDCTLDCSKARAMLKTKLRGVDEVLDLGIY
jgi:dTDP-4-dehydrorhamnose reductase